MFCDPTRAMTAVSVHNGGDVSNRALSMDVAKARARAKPWEEMQC